jgi:NOL1/NOP2/sun family putative RNA methylase
MQISLIYKSYSSRLAMSKNIRNLEPKPEFVNRINKQLKDKQDQEEFWKMSKTRTRTSIRCNTLKIQPEILKKQLEDKYDWKIAQPFKDYPEIMIMESQLQPGEIGKAHEHLLGYYYVQEIASMMPILTLKPTKQDSFLDLCASPGSKTTQAAAKMENQGILIANDKNLGRLMILAANLERTGTTNTISFQKDAKQLCKHLQKQDIEFDKILVDAPCTGEGTIRSSQKTYIMWNEKMFPRFTSTQKAIASAALNLLKKGGTMIYSTCTHAPEENEEVISYLLDNNSDIELQPIELPIKTRQGMTSWTTNNITKKYNPEVKKCARIYSHDNNTEGFFICKIKKLNKTKQKQEN